MRYVIRQILRDATLAHEPRTGTSHTWSWTDSLLPFLNDLDDPMLRRPMKQTVGRTAVAATVREVSATHLSPTKHEIGATARALILLTPYRINRSNDFAVR